MNCLNKFIIPLISTIKLEVVKCQHNFVFKWTFQLLKNHFECCHLIFLINYSDEVFSTHPDLLTNRLIISLYLYFSFLITHVYQIVDRSILSPVWRFCTLCDYWQLFCWMFFQCTFNIDFFRCCSDISTSNRRQRRDVWKETVCCVSCVHYLPRTFLKESSKVAKFIFDRKGISHRSVLHEWVVGEISAEILLFPL